MKNLTRSLACAACLLASTIAGAQFQEPPTIVVEMVERLVSARGAWGSEDPQGPSDGDDEEVLSDGLAPFLEQVEANTTSALARSWQESHISSFSVRGEGEVFADLSSAPYSGLASASSSVSLQFTVPTAAPFVLRGSFSFEPTDAQAQAGFGNVSLIGADPFIFKQVGSSDPEEDWDFLFVGSAPANSQVSLGVLVLAQFEKWSPSSKVNYTGQLTVSFEFTLDFGDRDGDGLLDDWEEQEGINFDADPDLEIDLSGADPDRKDLFVEVDVMQNVGFDQQAIDDVIRAFAEAPAAMVNNPDGSNGVQLHVVLDGDQPPHQELDTNPGFPPDYYVIKDAFFGSEDDRNRADWDDLRDVRLLVYRYCLWTDVFVDSFPGSLLGIAEAIPSNDFTVAAGKIQSISAFADVLTDTLAGVFMHELGHTLNLRHGGGLENSPNLKPNYLSVMNYAYVTPWDKTTNQGTNAREVWRLDYSRKAVDVLDENELLESEGLNGPQGRRILFNSAAEGSPTKINIARASAPRVDWNFSSGTDVTPYPRDISNLWNRPTSYDVLNSYTDWDRLWYHLAGGPEFNDRTPWPNAEPVQGLDDDTVLTILGAEWVDQTALGDVIFANGFELGSTTAWSETVP